MVNGSDTEEITESIKIARKCYQLVRNILREYEILRKGKMPMSILTSGAETWAWAKAEISRLTSIDF
jgi:hypothetical protein